jgi:hypothetical protein
VKGNFVDPRTAVSSFLRRYVERDRGGSCRGDAVNPLIPAISQQRAARNVKKKRRIPFWGWWR